MAFLKICFTKFGIEFEFRGDWIIYLWPWKRTFKDRPIYSTSFHRCYHDRKELNEDWGSYYRSTRQLVKLIKRAA